MALARPESELREMLFKARLVLSNLDREAIDLVKSPSRLDTETQAVGAAALEGAMTAARRLVASVEAALALDESGEAGRQPADE